MDDKRASLLEDLATDAGRRRDDFVTDAGRQFVRFLDANKSRLKELGGLVLIDDEPDYLFISPDGTFRSRTRYQDDDGNWHSETEDFDSGAELVEVYNPADLYAAFADAATAEIGAPAASAEESDDEAETSAEADGDLDVESEAVEPAADAAEEAPADELYAWLDRTPLAPQDQLDAARQMYDLALTFQEGSQYEQARLLDDFADRAAPAAALLGESKFVEDEDERLWLRSTGAIEGEVVPEHDEDDEGEPEWQPLATSDDMVQFYDPTDLFGDLAEAIADSYPEVAPELTDEAEAGDAGNDED
jgi:hypothetical protein